MILNSIDKDKSTFCEKFDVFYRKNNQKNLRQLKLSFKKIVDNYLRKKNYFLIIKNFERNKKKLEEKIKLFEKFTTLLIQNDKGTKIVKVSPKKKLLSKFKYNVKKKLRYHQTNLGGSIHSDGPQHVRPPSYVIMACSEQAEAGGESIITYANKIYKDLKDQNKKILNVLETNIIFERRGFSKIQKTFSKPIFINKKNNISFRYLRDYIESGYRIKKKKMSDIQIQAINKLDSMLSKKKYQIRYKLEKGDLILLNNNLLAHGRTTFKVNKDSNRTLLRAWIK